MTFNTFKNIFYSKYPDAEVFMHGKFNNNEKNGKVTVYFHKGSRKSYDYYGAYEDILCGVGIPTISRQRLEWEEQRLNRLKASHGKCEDEFFGSAEIIDNSKEIAELEARLADIYANWNIV